MGTGIKRDNAAVAVVGLGSHTAHMRPDESKQVLNSSILNFDGLLALFSLRSRFNAYFLGDFVGKKDTIKK